MAIEYNTEDDFFNLDIQRIAEQIKTLDGVIEVKTPFGGDIVIMFEDTIVTEDFNKQMLKKGYMPTVVADQEQVYEEDDMWPDVDGKHILVNYSTAVNFTL
jgi:hypothetical protein